MSPDGLLLIAVDEGNPSNYTIYIKQRVWLVIIFFGCIATNILILNVLCTCTFTHYTCYACIALMYYIIVYVHVHVHVYMFVMLVYTLYMYTHVDGRALLVNMYREVVLYHFNFKSRVYDIKFSPNGK